MTEVMTGAIQLIDFLNYAIHVRNGRTLKSNIVMKMDIEGGEYVMLSSLLTSGALCDISLAMVELHANQVSEDVRLDPLDGHMDRAYNYALGRSRSCRARIQVRDDETYSLGEDMNPLPQNKERVKRNRL
eukprot:CAMPEP_0182418634 /NCGR_PEP_ID=MMETSP1167-20130531/3014_1 /TAXON_ID=2988 /ORGANISM="Mallomonas Sp, Strain CCMP3275" /LENGTH=129 /DNA_ID=CAMNT_0024592923 /DNA_START=867 /DNA_END=1256 /DNA_ORIENTATION=-